MYTIKEDNYAMLFRVIGNLILMPWLAMLALGALGHRLDIPYLFKLGFFETFLICWVTPVFRGGYVTKWKVTKD